MKSSNAATSKVALMDRMFSLIFSGCNNDRYCSQYAPLKIAYKNEVYFVLSKQISFQRLQNIKKSLADQWTYIWGTTQFSPSKVSKQLIGHLGIHPVYK